MSAPKEKVSGNMTLCQIIEHVLHDLSPTSTINKTGCNYISSILKKYPTNYLKVVYLDKEYANFASKKNKYTAAMSKHGSDAPYLLFLLTKMLKISIDKGGNDLNGAVIKKSVLSNGALNYYFGHWINILFLI